MFRWCDVIRSGCIYVSFVYVQPIVDFRGISTMARWLLVIPSIYASTSIFPTKTAVPWMCAVTRWSTCWTPGIRTAVSGCAPASTPTPALTWSNAALFPATHGKTVLSYWPKPFAVVNTHWSLIRLCLCVCTVQYDAKYMPEGVALHSFSHMGFRWVQGKQTQETAV